MMIASSTSTTTVTQPDPDPDPPAPTTPGDLLCAAARASDLEEISRLSALATEPLRDSAGHTALHWAALDAGPGALLRVLGATRHEVDAVSLAPAQLGQTALHWAVVGGSAGCVAALLQAGARASAADANGYNALVHAAHYGRVDVAHVLLLADPALSAARDRAGRSALHWAANRGYHAMAVYLARVADPPADLAARDARGETPLHKAAARGHLAVARALVAAGADPLARDDAGTAAFPDGARARAAAGWAGRARAHGLVLFYYAVLALSYWFYLQYVDWVAPRGDAYGAVFHALAGGSLALHSFATYADPGELPVGSPRACRRDIEMAIAGGAGEVALGAARYCFTCLRRRVPRSKHSRSRGKCVRRFDHECPWINNAVGLRNHRPLLGFAASMLALQCLFLDHLREALVADKDVKSLWDACAKRPLGVGLAVLHGALAAFCAVLLVQHFYLAVKGLTTYEQIAYKRLGMQRNPYDFGVRRNICDFLTASGPGTAPVRPQQAVQGPRNVPATKGTENGLAEVVVQGTATSSGDREQVEQAIEDDVSKRLLEQ